MDEMATRFRYWDSSAEAAGWRIKLLRRTTGLSQPAFGAQMDLPKDTVAKWEQAKALPTLDHLKRMAKRFKVTTDFIVYGEWEYLDRPMRAALTDAAKAETSADAPGG